MTDILVLQGLKGVGNRTLTRLIDFYRANQLSSLEELVGFDLRKLLLNKDVFHRLRDLFSKNEYQALKRDCEACLSTWQEMGIDVLTYGSAGFPEQLSFVEDPPAMLFCKGNLGLLRSPKCIAVVGTRNHTPLGERIARKTTEHFSSEGFCIVSGLALGIDTVAHRAALDGHHHTISILVDLVGISPSSNRGLAEKILAQEGLLISENLPGTKPMPGLFVKRDRIQAGLSLAVFAIETAIDGGTMHAVRAAHAMGRKVYVPNAAAAGYPDLNLQQISGTQDLVDSGKATPYTRDDYTEITNELTRLASSFERSKTPGGLL